MKISLALRNSLLVPKVECWKWSICWTPKICSPVRKINTYLCSDNQKKCYGAKSKYVNTIRRYSQYGPKVHIF